MGPLDRSDEQCISLPFGKSAFSFHYAIQLCGSSVVPMQCGIGYKTFVAPRTLNRPF